MVNRVKAEVDFYAGSSVADAEQPVVLSAAVIRQLSKTPDGKRGGILSEALGGGGSGGAKCFDRTQPAVGRAHYEQELMREETLCGKQHGSVGALSAANR